PVVHENSEHIENALRAMSDRLDRMPVGSSNSESIENAVRALADRIDRMPVGNDNASAFAHLEQRVSYLLERLEASTDHRPSVDLGRVEDGLQDILRHLEAQHAAVARLADTGPNASADSGLIEIV